MSTIIIGAGISGLTAACRLHQLGQAVVVLDAGPEPGGLIRSWTEQDYLLEGGPNTFPSTATELLDVCRSLGITPKPASPLAKKRYLYVNGALSPLPANLWQALTTPILSFKGKKDLLRDLYVGGTPGIDPSIDEFFRHRLGAEAAENIADPFVSGIYAGDTRRLSLRSVFPKLHEWEQQGGLARGAMMGKGGPRIKKGPLQLLSFTGGLQHLTDVMANSLPTGAIRYNRRVNSLRHGQSGYTVTLENGELMQGRQVILAVPAYAAASLLQGICAPAIQALTNIPYGRLAVVHTGFSRTSIPHPLDGFGFLVPRKEKISLLGSIWASSLFPNRSPSLSQALLTNYVGGAHQPDMVDWPDEELIDQVVMDLRQVFGSQTLKPSFTKVLRNHQAIPQYTIGHYQRLELLDAALSGMTGLAVCGNYLHGVALNECVKSALAAVEKIGVL